MPRLSCPACGTHLELGLTAVTSPDQEEVDIPAVADVPNIPTVEPFSSRYVLKGQYIVVVPQKVIEVALKEVNPAKSTSRWVCTWLYEDRKAELPHPVRAVLMAYLQAEYPTVDWANSGVTTNDATRIIGNCPGFMVADMKSDGRGDLNLPNTRFLYKRPDGLPE